MKISWNQVKSAARAYGVQSGSTRKLEKGNERRIGAVRDQVSFSSYARDLQVARKAIDDAPDVRSEKVAQLRRAIARGEYKVDGRAVAEEMLGRLIVDRLIAPSE